MRIVKSFFYILFFILFSTKIIHAETIRPRQYGNETRFKFWNYNPEGVYYFEGFYMHPSYIEFDDDETINTVYTPKSKSWYIVPVKNRLFIKPIEENADTTLTVMTDNRTYFFELHAKHARNPFDAGITFFVKFRYPQISSRSTGQGAQMEDSIVQYITTQLPDLSKPELFNFNYTVSGNYNITPIKIFDDGKFTYFQFREQNGVLPAIFAVNSDGYESIINFRVLGPYIAVESVNAIFTLRHGSEIVCVFNETQMEIRKNNNFLVNSDSNLKK